MKPLFAEAKNLYGKVNAYPYQLQVNQAGYANMMLESTDISFDRDYETANVSRFL
jgi:hypothetical protein